MVSYNWGERHAPERWAFDFGLFTCSANATKRLSLPTRSLSRGDLLFIPHSSSLPNPHRLLLSLPSTWFTQLTHDKLETLPLLCNLPSASHNHHDTDHCHPCALYTTPISRTTLRYTSKATIHETRKTSGMISSRTTSPTEPSPGRRFSLSHSQECLRHHAVALVLARILTHNGMSTTSSSWLGTGHYRSSLKVRTYVCRYL
jgi:hypothetical protein